MDARMQKHRMARWLGRLFVAFALMTSWLAQAAVESVPPTISNWYCTFRDPNLPFYSSSFEEVVQRTLNYACHLPGIQGCISISANLESQPRGRFILGDLYFVLVYNNGFHTQPLGGSIYGEVKCPDPIVNPTVPYKYNSTKNMCERDTTLTITLSSGTEIEPSNGSDIKTLPIIATVKDQNDQPPTTPVTVRISLKVDPKSGGHDHGDSTRPRGGIAEVKTCPSDDVCWTSPQPTDGNGQVVFNFNAPEASGTHTITATCDGCSNNPQTKEVKVKVNGLLPIPASPTLYALADSKGDVIGAVKNVHADNHYLTEAAIEELGALANLFKSKVDSKVILYLNDASLVWGGLFDVDIDNPWSTPHKSHRTGESIDIRAQNSFPIKEGAVPITDFLYFITRANANNFKVALHCKGSTQTSVCYGKLNTRHFHVDF